MLPRALLFSSDEQASTVLREVLSELQIEVAHCREIFAAVEELTSRTFQVILIDWGQELEASFLFNMARELKSTRSTHILVVVDAQLAPMLVVSPNAFLEKPFTAEQARDVLLQSSLFRQLFPDSAQDRAPGHSDIRQEIAPIFQGSVTSAQSAICSDDDPLLAQEAVSTPRPLRKAASSASDSRLRGGLIRPETSTAKKTIALACLLTLLIAILRGEKELGYLPPGLFGYRQFTKLLFSPQKRALDPSPAASSASDVGMVSQVRDESLTDFAVSNRSENFSDRISVRPIFGQGFEHLRKQASPLAEFIESDVSREIVEPEGPSGANPLIPSSLYWPPQLASLHGGTTHSLFNRTTWSTAPIVISEETSRSLLVHQVLPSYPLEALRAGLQGTVVLQALVGRDGSVEDLKLVQGYFALGNAAISAVKQWRFRPYRINGEIVEMQTLLTVTFPLTSNETNRASSNGSLITYGPWK